MDGDPNDLARELGDVNAELTRVGDLASGVGRSLSNALRGAVVDGKSLKSVLGEVAMRSLMNHPDVDKATSGLGESVDVKKLQALFKEAGITIPEDEKK